MHDDSPQRFDFLAYRRAVERKDAPVWLDFFAEDAEWIEYKPTNPPRSPRRMVGRRQIGEFLEQVKSSDVVLEIEDEVIGPTRAAFARGRRGAALGPEPPARGERLYSP